MLMVLSVKMFVKLLMIEAIKTVFALLFSSEEVQQTIERWLRSKRRAEIDLAEPDR